MKPLIRVTEYSTVYSLALDLNHCLSKFIDYNFISDHQLIVRVGELVQASAVLREFKQRRRRRQRKRHFKI